LVITCPECRNYLAEEEMISTCFCLGGMLRRHDQFQEEWIRHHLVSSNCTQIIVAGHYSCDVVNQITKVHEHNISSPYVLAWKTDDLLREHARKFLHHEVRNKMITELNVLDQVQILLNFHFVKPRIKKGTLSVSGIIIDETHLRINEIIRNGIVFNDLIGSN
jgi:carbonic anhydrase